MIKKYKQYTFTIFFNTPKFKDDHAEKVLDLIIAFAACLGFEVNQEYTCGYVSEESVKDDSKRAEMVDKTTLAFEKFALAIDSFRKRITGDSEDINKMPGSLDLVEIPYLTFDDPDLKGSSEIEK